MLDYFHPPLPCPECSAPTGDPCRTSELKAGMPPHRARLVQWIIALSDQRDELQQANTREVLRRRAVEGAARYVLDNVPDYAGVLDHLRQALGEVD